MKSILDYIQKNPIYAKTEYKNLAEALSKLQGKDIRLTINLDDSNVTTPIEYRRNIYQALREKAQNELQKDSKLQILLNEFDAKLDVESIRPV